jgi:hypothetical protein
MGFIEMGAMLLGALAGGLLGETIGLRPALVIGAAGSFLAALWLFLSPVRSVAALPAAMWSRANSSVIE